MFNCPQCGEETETLHEGYCEECRDERQNELNEHNARFDFWERGTDVEKDFYIRSAAQCRFIGANPEGKTFFKSS